VLALIAAVGWGCTSASQPGSATPPAAARPKSSFGQSLSLAVSLGRALSVGNTSVPARFALTNKGSATFEGCFGPSWGVSLIVGGHDAGHLVRVEHPRCDEKLTLLAGQTIVWSKTVPLGTLRSGTAKVTGWVKLVDPSACDPRYGCREASVASPVTTVAVGER
jgi:hypothetical protein